MGYQPRVDISRIGITPSGQFFEKKTQYEKDYDEALEELNRLFPGVEVIEQYEPRPGLLGKILDFFFSDVPTGNRGTW